jgi:hypothetical protein
MASFIATPKLLLYSHKLPQSCKTPLLCSNKICFSPYSGAIGNSRKQTLVVVQLATTNEQTFDNLLTFRWEFFYLKPKFQQKFTRAQHNQRGN